MDGYSIVAANTAFSIADSWIPGPGVDPLDGPAVTAFYNVGPQLLTGLIKAQPPVTYWVPVGNPANRQYALTGLGAGGALGPKPLTHRGMRA
jgi:hypothetical protein